MKPSGETTFTIADTIIGFADEVQGEYVMRFLDPMPELHALGNARREYGAPHRRAGQLNGASGDRRPHGHTGRQNRAQRKHGAPHRRAGNVNGAMALGYRFGRRWSA